MILSKILQLFGSFLNFKMTFLLIFRRFFLILKLLFHLLWKFVKNQSFFSFQRQQRKRLNALWQIPYLYLQRPEEKVRKCLGQF